MTIINKEKQFCNNKLSSKDKLRFQAKYEVQREKNLGDKIKFMKNNFQSSTCIKVCNEQNGRNNFLFDVDTQAI